MSGDALLHPVRTLEEGLDLIDVLDRHMRLLAAMESRQTELESLLKGGLLNHVLFSGGVSVPANAWVNLTALTVPFAAVTVADPNGVGNLIVANDAINDPVVERAREGRWNVAKNSGPVTFPLAGRELSIASAVGTAGIVYVAILTRVPGMNN